MSIVKYKYDLYPHNDMFYWVVLEEETGYSVGVYMFEDDAIAQMKFLTNGGGFDGFTPGFMAAHTLKHIKTQEYTS